MRNSYKFGLLIIGIILFFLNINLSNHDGRENYIEIQNNVEINCDKGTLELLAPYAEKLEKLKKITLTIHSKNIIPVEIGAFKQLEELNIINLCSTKHPPLSFPESIVELKKLKVLRLADTNLEVLPKTIGALTNLEELYLDKNNLKYLPEEIGNCQALKIVSIQHALLEKLPKSFNKLKKLEVLVLHENSLTELNLRGLNKLKSLVVSKNSLTRMPKGLSSLEALYEVHLQYNEIDAIADDFYISAKRLFLGYNLLNTIPSSIFKCKNIEELSFKSNFIEELPEEIGELKALQILDLWRNALTTLPKTIQELNRLRKIDISENDFDEVPAIDFVKMKNLHTVLLHKNNLSSDNAAVIKLKQYNIQVGL